MRACVSRLAGNASVIVTDKLKNSDSVPDSADENSNDNEEDDVMSIDDVIVYFNDLNDNKNCSSPAGRAGAAPIEVKVLI